MCPGETRYGPGPLPGRRRTAPHRTAPNRTEPHPTNNERATNEAPVRPRITHPKAAVTTRATAVLAAGCTGLLLVLTGCGSPSAADAPPSAASGSGAKNGDTPPESQTLAGTARVPVPRGAGSRVPYDFNGDGHRDLVIDDLVKAPEDRHGDDAGIGVVYGSDDRPLDPAARQLLSARANAAKSGDTLPAAFDAESACDLDRDGFTDLIVSTDPPYNGIGAPPVPLQILFGSPAGPDGQGGHRTHPAAGPVRQRVARAAGLRRLRRRRQGRPRGHGQRRPGHLPARPLHPHRGPAQRGTAPRRRPVPLRPRTQGRHRRGRLRRPRRRRPPARPRPAGQGHPPPRLREGPGPPGRHVRVRRGEAPQGAAERDGDHPHRPPGPRRLRRRQEAGHGGADVPGRAPGSDRPLRGG